MKTSEVLKRFNQFKEESQKICDTIDINKLMIDGANFYNQPYYDFGYVLGYIFDIQDKHDEFIDILKDITKKFEYVYIIKGTHQGNQKYKIGKASDFKNRVKTFNVKIPFDIEVVATFYVHNALELEGEMHSQMKHKRIAGEWFDLIWEEILQLKAFGTSKECESIGRALDNELKRLDKMLRMSNEDYIEYLESILVMNNIKFDRGGIKYSDIS